MPHLYRSDLGGMAPVPADARVAGSTTYVPTTSTAKYLPRRHNHTYNGSAWVDAGTLIETEARTNLVTYSEDFTDASWGKFDATVSANSAASPSGESTADKFVEGTGSSIHRLTTSTTITSGLAYTFSVFAKAGERNLILLRNNNGSTDEDTFFDLLSRSDRDWETEKV